MKQKNLYIRRTGPNDGVVVEIGNYFDEKTITEPMPYQQCVNYVLEHRKDLTVYKIARILPRKNAKRTLYKKILAVDNNEAVVIFNDMCSGAPENVRLQLLTGDWKLIAEKDCNGLINII